MLTVISQKHFAADKDNQMMTTTLTLWLQHISIFEVTNFIPVCEPIFKRNTAMALDIN